MAEESGKRKTALVTGAARRIGRATALALAKSGADVVVHFNRSANEAEETAAEIRSLGCSAWTAQADLADSSKAGRLMESAVGMAGHVDILVNNASIFRNGKVLEFAENELELNVRINAFSPLVLARAFAAQGRAGSIVNLLDARMVSYDSEHAAYSLSKRMLFSITRMLALELAPLIRVNAVAPGVIVPPDGEGQRYLERMKRTNPLASAGDLKGVTDAVLFLVASEFVTGQVIFVDGGRHLLNSVYG